MNNQVIDAGMRLEAVFTQIALTRMRDLPVSNPDLQVEALGFRPWNQGNLGILITPWCMNLVWIPDDQAVWSGIPSGVRQLLDLPSGEYEFLTAGEPAIGAWLASSLFSPMFGFDSMTRAREVATMVLAEVLALPETSRPEPDPAHTAGMSGRLAQPVSRRHFLDAFIRPIHSGR